MNQDYKTKLTTSRQSDLPWENDLKNILMKDYTYNSRSWDIKASDWKDCLSPQETNSIDCGYLELSASSINYKLKISFERDNDTSGTWRVWVVRNTGNQVNHWSNVTESWKNSINIDYDKLTKFENNNENGWSQVSDAAFIQKVNNLFSKK